MSREWKPGDVALLTISERSDARRRQHGPVIGIRDNVDSWACGAAVARQVDDFDVRDARPLVVIDPEDRQQVERLVKALSSGQPLTGLDPTNRELVDAAWIKYTQAALREFANPTPTKPDEPTGLGAVVAAKCGCQPNDEVRFVRDPDARDFNLPWDAKNVATGAEVPWVSRCGHHRYTDLAAVRVLSEGVTA